MYIESCEGCKTADNSTKDDRVECDMKWEHILKYIQLGPYQVENGQTVAEFLKSLN